MSNISERIERKTAVFERKTVESTDFPEIAKTEEGAKSLGRSMGSSSSAALRVIGASEYHSHLGRALKGTQGSDGLVEQLDVLSKELRQGKMAAVEDMLVHQAVALQSLFTRLIESAYLSQNSPAEHFDMKMRYAFRAQAQCRATLETLAAVKNPPVVFAKQANLSAGPQQVNNGPVTNGGPLAREDDSTPNKLSGESIELRQNTRTPAPTGGSDTPVATLGQINGPPHARRKEAQFAERLEGRSKTCAARAGEGPEGLRASAQPKRLKAAAMGSEDWGRYGVYEEHGMWVPNGMTAAEIVKGTRAITNQFDIDKFTAHDIAIAVLRSLRAEPPAQVHQESPPAPRTEP